MHYGAGTIMPKSAVAEDAFALKSPRALRGLVPAARADSLTGARKGRRPAKVLASSKGSATAGTERR
jgi:hypothetical protein